MSHFFDWCGFLGAWLLVAGPLLQATRELQEEDIERGDMARAAATLPRPPPVSAWWLLLPPAYYWLRQRRLHAYRQAVLKAMPSEKAQAFRSFREKADAWLFVASGAALLALKETWSLRETYGWPAAVFWLLVALMGSLCVANTLAQVHRAKDG